MADQPDDFSTEERRALDAWQARSAPAGFADAVLARQHVQAQPVEARRPFKNWAVPSLIAAMLALGLVSRVASIPVSGSLVSEARTDIHLGSRGVAIAEAGARLDWAVAFNADATVTQSAGDVFYRVEPGGSFDVKTPAGTVHVTGTCFRVEVNEMKSTGLKLAGIGALAAIAVVTVYEGTVLVTSNGADQAVSVSAGRAAVLDGKSATVVDAPHGRGPANAVRGTGIPFEPSTGASASAMVPAGGAGAMPAKLETAQQEIVALRAQVARLESDLKQSQANGLGLVQTYNLSQADLEEMARNCELRWDMPRVDLQNASTVSPEDAEALKLTDKQREALDAVLKKYNQSMVKQIRDLYVEVTNDPNAGSMAIDSMMTEIADKTPKADQQRAYQAISRERAGLSNPPADLSKVSPFERLRRLQQSAGDSLVDQMRAVVGATTAEGLRDLHKGFDTQFRTSAAGCPPGSSPSQ